MAAAAFLTGARALYGRFTQRVTPAASSMAFSIPVIAAGMPASAPP